MIPQASIVATDDNRQHLNAIVNCFEMLGTACLPLQYLDGELKIVRKLTSVKLVFFDLNYVPGVPSGPMLFDIAAGVLQQVVQPNNGPYVLVTWSSHADEHQEFLRHVCVNCPEIPPPSASTFLDKIPFISGSGSGAGIQGEKVVEMARVIAEMIDSIPQVAAMLHWEETGRSAAGEVISSLVELIPRECCFLGKSGRPLEDLLLKIARTAVGKNNVGGNRLAAINDGLGPILLDQLMHTTEGRQQELRAVWERALPDLDRDVGLTVEQVGELNARTLVSSRDVTGVAPGDRGAVCTLGERLQGAVFTDTFGMDSRTLVGSFVALKPNERMLDEARERFLGECQWRLVGSRAACDQAQGHGDVIKRVFLALEVPCSSMQKV